MKIVLPDRIIDLELGRVSAGSERHSLTHNEQKLLHYLVQHPDTAVSRHTLHQEVWGYNTRVVTRAVDSTVKRLRRKIEADPAHPRYLVTVYSIGYRLVVPSAGDTDGTGERLAPPSVPCVGRADLLEELAAALGRPGQVVSVTGPGGIGKSFLVRALLSDPQRLTAWDVASVVRVGLGESQALSEAIALAATRLRVTLPDTAEGGWRALATTRLDGNAVLLLDDADPFLSEIEPLIVAAQAMNPVLRVVITSRERYPHASRQVLVGPLSAQDSTADFDATLDRMGRKSVVEQGDMLALTEALEGVPLALEIAAEHLGLLAPVELLKRLQTTPLVLQTAIERDPRHQSLDAVVSDSWERLSAEEQSAIAQLSVFASSFNADAAEAVLRDVGPPLAMLQRLRNQSLLLTTTARGAHLRLLKLVKQFSIGRAPDIRTEATARHAAWVLREGSVLVTALLASPWTLQVSAASRWAPNPVVLESLTALELDLEAAVQRRVGSPDSHAERVLILDVLWAHRGTLTRRERLLETTIAQRNGMSVPLVCRVLAAQGAVRFANGDLQRAAQVLEEAEATGKDLPPTLHHVTVCRALAAISSWSGDSAQAHRWLLLARRHGEAIGRQDLVAALLYDEGRLMDRQGEIAASRRCFRELQHLSTQRQDRHGEAYAHYCLAYSNLNHGDFQAAEIHIQRSLAAQAISGTVAITGIQTVRALIALAREDEGTAEKILLRSVVATNERGDQRLTAEDLMWLAITAQLTGRLEEARLRYEDARAVAISSEAPVIAIHARCLRGSVLAALGDPDSGLEQMDAALLELDGKGWRAGMSLDIAGLRLLRTIGLRQQAAHHAAAGRDDHATALRAQMASLAEEAKRPQGPMQVVPVEGSFLTQLVARIVARGDHAASPSPENP